MLAPIIFHGGVVSAPILELFMLLRQAAQYVLASDVKPSVISDLRKVLSEYHTKRQSVFPQVAATINDHKSLHIPVRCSGECPIIDII